MKELLDSIIKFLEDNLGDNYIWITAGAVILVLIIIIAVAAVKKKKPTDDEAECGQEAPRDFFLEGEYDTMLRDAAHALRTGSEAAAEPEVQEPELSGAPAEPDDPEVTEATAEEQDALKEELQQVHININIERGQVRIGYEEDGKVTCIVETDEEQVNDPELTAALAAGVTELEEDSAPDAAEPEKAAEDREFLAGQGIVLEKINLVKAAPVKKFGPDNFNTGRSGRVFTEEELREQIKQ